MLEHSIYKSLIAELCDEKIFRKSTSNVENLSLQRYSSMYQLQCEAETCTKPMKKDYPALSLRRRKISLNKSNHSFYQERSSMSEDRQRASRFENFGSSAASRAACHQSFQESRQIYQECSLTTRNISLSTDFMRRTSLNSLVGTSASKEYPSQSSIETSSTSRVHSCAPHCDYLMSSAHSEASPLNRYDYNSRRKKSSLYKDNTFIPRFACSTAPIYPTVSPIEENGKEGFRKEDEDDIYEIINEPHVIEEKRRIMQEIRRDKKNSNIKLKSECSEADAEITEMVMQQVPDLENKRNFSTTNDDIQSIHYKDFPLNRSFRYSQQTCLERSFSQSSLHASNTDHRCENPREYKQVGQKFHNYEDTVAELQEGVNLHLRGTKHTWNNISKGRATIVQCPSCQTILQVSTGTNLLFCTVCREISPINPKRCNVGVIEGFDSKIAKVIQDQELEIVIAAKTARC